MRIKGIILSVFVLIAIFVIVGQASSAVIYVKHDSPNDGPGNDWDHAYHTITAALNAAVSGDEVWVAKGTYIEWIYLNNSISIYGGFTGTETNRDQRDWKVNETIIDGNQKSTVINTSSGITASAYIDGFTIRNAYYGISSHNFKLTIENNIITGNHIGIISSGSSFKITIKNNIIKGNSAGGIACYSFSSAIITNNIIAENDGIGISCSQSSPTIAYNIIKINGCGISCSTSSSPIISSNKITGNIPYNDSEGSGIYCESSSPKIINNTISGNYKSIYCKSASPTIANNIVVFNSLGIYNTGGSPTLRNNNVYSNFNYNYSGLNPGVGDISIDPAFASNEYDNIHIRLDSPCINAGWNDAPGLSALDIDGQTRIQDGTVDIGADESDGNDPPIEPYVIVRVSPDGDDSNDGSSWALAKRTIQAAINTAASVGGEVWVKAGIYNERLMMLPYTYLYGGFSGFETAQSERDWTINKSIINSNDLYGAGGSIILSAVNHSCINGFTIRNGKSGGINCYYSSLIIANNTITNNITSREGGGIYCYYSSPKIVNNIINGNTSVDNGGGIYCYYSSPNIVNNIINENTSVDNGGGIYCYYSSPTILNNIISGNRTVTNKYGGGGIYCSYSAANIINNIITGNITSGSGAGILCDYQSSPTITNNTICGNSVPDGCEGGGIFSYNASPIITNNIIAFNSSGIYNSNSTPTLQNNNVYSNTSYDYSGLSTGEGDISADPLFVNRAEGDYHLLPTSPCINKGWNSAPGIPEIDMDGQPRINGVIDIGADEYWMPPSEAIGAARASEDDLSQDIFGATVSAAFDGFFYIEADDRSSGIRVNKADHTLEEGMRARVIGTLTTNHDGERCIDASEVYTCNPPNDRGYVGSLGMNTKMIGGGDWQFNSDTGAGQRGVFGGIGLNNIGLLIRTFGKVVDRDTSLIPTWYKISDGSPAGSIKVVVPVGSSVPEIDTYVTVTGISSCYKDGLLYCPQILQK